MTNPEAELALSLQVACDRPDLPDQRQLAAWAAAAVAVGTGGELTIRLVDEDESQALNRQYRGKDSPTNVLSFPFEPPEGLPADALPPVLGDLVICADVVAREAAEHNKPPMAHWAHMVVHGVLHLLGFDHQQDDEAERMEAMETQIMATLGFENPYQLKEEIGEI